jgi:hypothetical protein
MYIQPKPEMSEMSYMLGIRTNITNNKYAIIKIVNMPNSQTSHFIRLTTENKNRTMKRIKKEINNSENDINSPSFFVA